MEFWPTVPDPNRLDLIKSSDCESTRTFPKVKRMLRLQPEDSGSLAAGPSPQHRVSPEDQLLTSPRGRDRTCGPSEKLKKPIKSLKAATEEPEGMERWPLILSISVLLDLITCMYYYQDNKIIFI